MPTRKDKTNVAPIYREQVFIPASGATLMKQKARPKVAGRPVNSGAIEIVSPEFDLLTGIRGIATLKNLPINITSKNAHKIKDKDWDKLYSAAIDKGDVEEIKRLRDLHFQAKSRNNFIINEDGTPKHLYHATKNKFNSFDLNKAGTGSGNLSNTEGVVYFSPYKEASLDVFRPKKSEVNDFNIMDLYVNNANPVNVKLSDFIKTWNNKEEFLKLRNAGEGIIAKGIKSPQQYYDEAVKKYLEKEKSGTLSIFDRKPESVKEFMEEQLVDNYTINNPNNIKSAKAITYDDNGNLIPLSKRDNFSINDIRMKCGGRRKAQLGLDIREGGIAIPIAPNMYYMDGRSHDEGGIAIGPNNKNGLEVEGGEVVKVGKNDVKVFSSVPLLRGVSPAQLVMGGVNPNKVFAAQEDFKDRNRINDDGTTYEMGGNKVIHINNLPSSFKGQLRNGRYVQIGIPPITNKAKSWNNTFKDHVNSLNVEMKNFIMDGIKYGKQILPKPLRKYYARGINILNSPGVEGINNTAQKITQIRAITDEKKAGGIYIKPSKRGTFTAAATKHGMGVQEFASKVLANKEDYSPAMVKKANFARNASRWKKEYGGDDTKTAVLKRLRNKFTIAGEYGDGMFGGAGAGSVIMAQPEYVTDTITKKYLVPVTQNFNDAFGNAVDAGLDKFMFDNKWYNTKKGNNPNNNAAGAVRTQTVYLPVEHKEVRRRKKEFGGSMIYTINGNVKNGLMSARPKAQYGKEKKINENTKIGNDGLIYKRDARGEWWTDGTTYQNSKYYMREQSVQRGGKRSTGEVVKPKGQTQSLPEVVVTAKAPKTESKNIKLSTLEEDYMTDNRRSANRHPVPDFVGKVNKDKEAVSSNVNSTLRKRTTKASTPKATVKTTPTIQDTVNEITRNAIYKSNTPKIDLSKAKMPTFDVSQLGSKETKAAKAKLNTPPTGSGTQSKDGRWIGQYKTTNAGDWIGLGSNVLGSLLSYGLTKSAINKMPLPSKPVLAQAAKLKTTYNVEPQLSEIREAEQMNRAAVRRNTQSSNTSLAREQRLMNEARGARNTLYGQKENIETQLINQDRLNRQSVMRDNVRAYNEYLNKLTDSKIGQNKLRVSNVNNLISGLTGSVNNILGTIESRRATNNTLRAIAAANPNVDARLIGGFDYYIDPITKKKYNKNQQYVGTING